MNSLASIPGPDDITRVELANGIIVLARANFNSPSIALSGRLASGSLFDPDEKLGLSDFTAASLMRGTASHDFQQTYDALESAGASLGFSGGTHTTGFGGKSLAEDLDLLLELLAGSLRQPTFPTDQVERLRSQMLTGLAMRAQSTGDMASLTFDQIVYAHHPYSRPEDGYPETIKSIAVKDLATFHARHYGPRGMTLAIVGGIDPAKAVEKVRAALEDWENPEQPEVPELPACTPLTKNVSQRVEISGKSQSDLVLGAAGPARRAADYMAASIGNNILGQFGMMGRIGEVVREQAGLAYYAYSGLGGGLGPGPWSVSAGVNPANEQRAVDLILSEVNRFTTELVSEDELSDTQANYIGRMPLSLEANNGVAGALLAVERYGLGLDYYQRYPELVRAITREQVLEAAANYLHPERVGIAIAGPPANSEGN
ncbi:MAG: insulinase family protein [Anaerolineae bacterium]|nr:insulinase family protein [Anaerolineae bacterium]